MSVGGWGGGGGGGAAVRDRVFRRTDEGGFPKWSLEAKPL